MGFDLSRRELSRRDLGVAATIGGALFGLYLATLCPTVPPGDSGELITVAHTLGVAHPPGYPLFTLLGKVATWIPVGTIAARVNALSAICQAAAAALLVVAVRVLTGRLAAAVVAGLAFGLARLVWRYATVAEVFALNDLFAAAILAVLALLWARDERASREPGTSGDGRLLAALAVLFGLGLTNHHTLGLVFGPAIVAFLALRERRLRRRLGTRSLTTKRLLAGLALVALGLLPYAYLPLAASAQPLLDWDHPVTLDRFVRLLLRRDYGSLTLVPSVTEAGSLGPLAHVFLAARTWVDNLTPVGAILAIIGVVAITRRSEWLAFFVASGASALGFFLLVRTPEKSALFLSVVERFYLLPLLLGAALLGIGLAAAMDRLPRASALAVAGAAGIGAIALGVARFPDLDASGNRLTRAYASNLLACLEPNSLLVSGGDLPHNAVSYAKVVEGERPDVLDLDQYLLGYDWYVAGLRRRLPDLEVPFAALTGRPGENLLALFDACAPSRPIAVYGVVDASFRERYVTCPVGLVERVYAAGSAPSLEAIEAAHDAVMEKLDLSELRRPYPEGTFEALAARDHSFGDRALAEQWFSRARSISAPEERRAAFDRGVKRLEKAIARLPFDAEPHRLLAQLYLGQETRDLGSARRHLERVRVLSPPGSDERKWAELLLPMAESRG